MYPVLFRLGPVSIESFWVMLFLGFFVALQVVRSEFERIGYPAAWAYDFILYAYVGGLIGARLFLLTSAWDIFVRGNRQHMGVMDIVWPVTAYCSRTPSATSPGPRRR